MKVKRNVAIAAGVSVALHLMVLYAIGVGVRAPRESMTLNTTPPIQMRFAPRPEPEKPHTRQLIETVTPAETAPEEAEFIADTNANAADLKNTESTERGPSTLEEASFDQLRTVAPQEAIAAPSPPPTSPSIASEPMPTTTSAEEKPPVETPPNEKLARLESPAKALPPVPAAVAAAASPPQPKPQSSDEAAPKLPEGRTMGKKRGGVDAIGFVGFEAMEDEIAPYLREIQDAVELRWREMLMTRYSGVSPTLAEVDCEIGKDGKIVRLEIAGAASDPVYGALCRFAIEKAGPFKPFPFTVPPEYANQNLEIRWTFNFLTR